MLTIKNTCLPYKNKYIYIKLTKNNYLMNKEKK